MIADSILGYALDHEALYSLLADLKPMSSIGFALSYPLGKDSLQFDGQHDVVNLNEESTQLSLDEVNSWDRILNALSFENYQFLLIPFRQVWKGNRNMQILICRTDLLDKLLEKKAPFFAQWGFVPGYDPAVVLTAVEFEERNDRYRAYGYLFGYPEHAVDFFVDASIEYQKTDEFVKRSFFNIPVFSDEKGYFTYALPEDFIPIAKDSMILKESALVLKEYQSIRPAYVNKEGKLEAIQLFRDWWKESIKN
ncbi:MAG: hypothetical protein AAFO07_33290 [Bacteroidota bacterium]